MSDALALAAPAAQPALRRSVARFLKARGYEFIQFGSWWAGTYKNAVADENRPHGFSEFGMIYWRGTALRPIFHALPDTPLTMRLDWSSS